MNISQISSVTALWRYVLVLALLTLGQQVYAQAQLQSIDFAALSNDQFEIRLGFNQAPPQPEIFLIEQPARLTLDFPQVTSTLAERRYPLTYNLADSLMVLEAQGRMRLVVNLTQTTIYQTSVAGNVMRIVVGGGNAGTVSANADAGSFVAPTSAGSDITGVDFRRGSKNEGMVVVDLANPKMSATVTQNGTRLLIEFPNASIEDNDQVRLDVTDFGTPVQGVSMYRQDGKVVVQADVTGEYEYLAYQADDQYTLTVTPVVLEEAGPRNNQPKEYTGERISLNFQDIEVRALLQILADFNDFNLVVGDSVQGTMAVRLDNVPWDQALDMVLRNRGLDKRQEGTVIYVAPAAEIANAEKIAMEATQQVKTLAPLVTEYIEVNYAVASELATLLQAAEGQPGGVLTERGRASVDVRTNTIIVQDVETVLEDVRAMIAKLDVPVRQVLIEARIVNANTNFSQALGVRWGGAQNLPGAGDQFVLSGSLDATTDILDSFSSVNRAVALAQANGSSVAQAIANNPVDVPFPDALGVNLSVPGASSSIALGYAGNSSLLQLELSALESSGNGEVIAQPKITTQDQQKANITSGLQIPYQSQAGGTAGGTTTEFVTAALVLEVTPQITPDGRIIMQLRINQDAVVPGAGSVPAISTNSIDTRVLVNNGDTVVLGGVFREEVTTQVSKTPFLGDLPYLGNLFKRTEDSRQKTELLIFITPSIINDLI